MATSQLTIGAGVALTQIWDFPKLKGQENYHFWLKKMRSALNYCGLWDVVDSTDSFLTDPSNSRDVLQADGSITQTQHVATQEEALAYQAALKQWKNLNNQAAELIYSMCTEKPADSIEDEPIARNRWLSLEIDYMDSGFVLRFTKLQDLWTTTLTSSNGSIETYVANLRTKAKDLKRMGAQIDDWILVWILLNNLDGKFRDFVHRLLTTLDELPNFDKIVTTLHEEDRLLKRDNKDQAMAAAMKRYQKEQEDKKASKSNNSGSNTNNSNSNSTRGKGNNSSNNGASNKPNSPNYKGEGEPPECMKCEPLANGTRKKHWLFNCWTTHPEKKKHKNSKPKANVANKDRLDDFEDRGSTHISAMGHVILCDHGDVGDDEFWGHTFTHTTPKSGEEALSVEPDIAILERMSPVINTVESAETESTPERAAIPKMDCDASQVVEEYLASPPISPNFAIVDKLSKKVSEYFHAYSSSKDFLPTGPYDWMIDSGCTNHMYFD